MKIYYGTANDRDWEVLVREYSLPGPGAKLNPRLDLANKSPDGFSWGYGGSGPSQLALALLADALDDDVRALRIYQRFKWFLISGIPQDADWMLSDTIIKVMAARLERQQAEMVNPS